MSEEDKSFTLWCTPGQEVRPVVPKYVCPVCGFEVQMPIRIQTKDGSYYTPCLSCLADVLINMGIPEMKRLPDSSSLKEKKYGNT